MFFRDDDPIPPRSWTSEHMLAPKKSVGPQERTATCSDDVAPPSFAGQHNHSFGGDDPVRNASFEFRVPRPSRSESIGGGNSHAATITTPSGKISSGILER